MMNSDLYVGIMFADDHLDVTTMDDHHHATHISFPATLPGLDAIRDFLNRCARSAHLAIAIAGNTAFDLAVSLKNLLDAHIFVVSPAIASQSRDLALYAKLTV